MILFWFAAYILNSTSFDYFQAADSIQKMFSVRELGRQKPKSNLLCDVLMPKRAICNLYKNEILT